jgi:hypothetical protein
LRPWRKTALAATDAETTNNKELKAAAAAAEQEFVESTDTAATQAAISDNTIKVGRCSLNR